ncbi:MAG: XdhC family protein [Anaerolineales bacterium]
MLNYLTHAHTLSEAGRPFVIATVVRAEKPTSAKAGAKAIVTADGQLDGWVGGSCAQPTVIRESLKALQDGQPRFLRMCPPERMRGNEPGVTEVVLACISGGTLEIYLEPHLPAPHLLAIGHLPVVEALAALAKAMNYSVTVAGENANREQFPSADRVTEFDAAQLTFTPQTFVVVASHGNYDEPALEAALQSEAAYVALVASQKRREAVLDYLRGSGLSEAQLARLRCPAGLDFGAVTPEEIALSILAEIVQLRRRGQVASGKGKVASEASPPVAPSLVTPALPPSILTMRATAQAVTPGEGEAVDPVCHMLVEIATAKWKSEYQGQWYYFCAPGCKRTFEKNPEQFVVNSQQ